MPVYMTIRCCVIHSPISADQINMGTNQHFIFVFASKIVIHFNLKTVGLCTNMCSKCRNFSRRFSSSKLISSPEHMICIRPLSIILVKITSESPIRFKICSVVFYLNVGSFIKLLTMIRNQYSADT